MNRNFNGNKVAMLGWGLDTEDVVPYLLSQGAKVTVYDRKTEIITDWRKDSRIDWKLGREDFGDLSGFDLILRNPAVYRYRKEITEAEKKGAEITSKMNLFFELCPCRIIGVTGTKGKGTTSTLIYEILKKAGRDVFLGGNIGATVFGFLPELTESSWVILELSSFQLIDLNYSPHIAVVLMVTSEHQDWHTSVEEYVNAKKNIVSHQKREDYAVVNSDYPNSREIGNAAKGKLIWVSKDALIKMTRDEIGLRGEHNRENVVAAATAAKLAGVEEEIIRQVIKNFRGLEHRLEEAGEVSGVSFFNDSFSTVPETAVAAIKSFSEPLVLIAGGSEKGSDFTLMGEVIASSKNIRGLVLIGLMTGRIKEAVENAGKPESLQIVTGARNMTEAVQMAYNMARKGDIVLLSPAAASFDMFRNYKDRGNQFKEAVKSLSPKE